MKETENILNDFSNRVNKVETPDYLLTRINAKISSTVEEYASAKLIWSTAFTVLFFMVVNLSTVINVGAQSNSTNDSSSEIETLANEMNMNANNQLYENH